MKGSVAFVCAMPMELAAVRRAASLGKDATGRGRLLGRVGRHDVVAIATGMGTGLGRRSTAALLDSVDVSHVLVVGIAGGVDKNTPIGTVVRPGLVIDAATGSELVPRQIGVAPADGALWTTDTITTPSELADLRSRGVIALDMETAAIGDVCVQRGVPWSVFRAISDDPSDEVDEEVFRMSNQDGSPNAANVVRYLVRHPNRIPRLARMGRNSKLAADRAAAAAVGACGELA